MGKGRYGGRRASAFIFDLDGTLVDSGRDIARSANAVRVHFGLAELEPARAVSFVGDGVEKLLSRALGADAAPPDAARLAEGLAVFRDHYGRHCLDETRLYPGVFDVLRRFSRYPLMVATNKPREFTLRVLEGLRLKDAFVRIVAGDDVPVKKPDPAMLVACLAGIDVPPGEVVMVGDSHNDVLAAHALGCLAVGCTYGLSDPGRLRAAGPDHVIGAFAELADLFPSRDTL
jgi:phosphoglycolate phosphatase